MCPSSGHVIREQFFMIGAEYILRYGLLPTTALVVNIVISQSNYCDM